MKFNRSTHPKFFYYWEGLIEGDILERLNAYKYAKYVLVFIAFCLVMIAMSLIFQGEMVRQRASKKQLDETSIVHKEVLYNKEKTESLNAIMTKLDEVGSSLNFPEKPATNIKNINEEQ